VKFLEVSRQKGPLPTHMSFVTIQPNELMVSAIKKAYTDHDLVIRLFNPTRVTLKGQVEIFPGIHQAWITDMNEEKIEKIPVRSDGTISVKAKPKKIITIRITCRK
jgi:alpha-mannosidase